jgi:hypothetical protein
MSTAVAKLVRQIRDALAADASNAPVESLATEYARLCQEANQRLESCAAMLEKGSEYQALQLAETEPVLLDLVAALSFAEAPEWAGYCAANQLPAPPKFESKAVQALDRLYAKGISANHPLYKDYRAAVTSRDDAKAIQIIRSIVRLNPDDANAKSELARIENKLFQLKLQELRTALSQREENTSLSTLSELERLATGTRLAELSEYPRACEVRREVARREAITVAERLVESLHQERQAGAWRMVGDILARLRALQSEHGVSLSEKHATECVDMQQYFDAQRAAADEAARFGQALATLGGLAESFDSRLLTRSTLTFGEAQNLHAEFNRRWKEVEKFQRKVPDDFIQRVRTSAGALRAELDRLQRQRRLKIVFASAAAITVIGVAAWFTISAMRAQDYATQLAGLRDAGQVEAAEKMIAGVRTEHAALAAQPKLTARLDEVDQWARDERTKLADIEGRLTALETTAKAGMTDADPMALATKLESTGQLVDTVANALRGVAAGRLLVLRNQFDAHVTVLRGKLIAQADDELTALETLAGAKLGYDQPKEVLTQALAELEPGLKSLEARVKPAVAVLELPSTQQARVSALRKRADLFHAEVDALAKVNEAILQATTLETFLQALSGYKTSRLAQAHEVNGARKLLAAFPKIDDLLAGLLLPGDPVGWAAAKADATGEALAPDTVLPAEISKLMALRDDNYLNDIWEVTFIDFRRKSERRELYARGDVKKEGPNQVGDAQITRWVGAIHDPGTKTEIPAFVPTTVSLQKSAFGVAGDGEIIAKRLSAASECLSRLELNRMTDAAGSKFERPLLRVFDDLVHDKSANALFKAYLMQQLGAVLNVRPYAWGLEYCASLRGDLEELDRLCDGAGLRSQDWLLERKRTQFGSKLTAFFNGLQNRSYLAEARLHREVVRGVLKAGLQFGGFIDSAGQPHLLGEARSSKALWALAADGRKLTRYLPTEGPREAAKQEITAFSPVFFVPLDRDALLGQAGRKAPHQPAGLTKLPAIPWLENP